MKNDLIERYIYAVTKRMPAKLQSDISSELETLISDMLDERCGDITPTEKDVRVVLTELGTPAELASKYDNSDKKSLIGPAYFSTYKTVLKIVLLCTGFGVSIATIFTQATEQSEPLFMAILQIIGSIFMAIVFAFAFVTLIFAFFEHNGTEIKIPYGLDDLPPVPKSNTRISKWEPIVGIVFSVIFSVVFLIAPQIFGAKLSSGQYIPFLAVDMIRSTWYIILAFMLLGVANECVKLIDEKYTHRVMITSIVTNLLSGALAVFWLTNGNIINPQFTSEMTKLLGSEVQILNSLFLNFQTFLLAVIIFALLLDCATTVFKTLRSPNK